MEPSISRRAALASGGMVVASSVAGCLGGSGPDIAEDEYPPGTSSDGVDDRQTLVDTTVDALGQSGYIISLIGPHPTELQYRSSLSTGRHLRRVDHGDQQIVVYVADGAAYARLTELGEHTYGKKSIDRSFRDIHASRSTLGMEFGGGNLAFANVVSEVQKSHSLQGILQFGSFQPTQLRDLDDRSVIQFTLQSVDASGFDGGNKTVSGSLSVDLDGVVRGASAKVTEDEDDSSQTDRHNRFRITEQGGVSVSEPEWVEGRSLKRSDS